MTPVKRGDASTSAEPKIVTAAHSALPAVQDRTRLFCNTAHACHLNDRTAQAGPGVFATYRRLCGCYRAATANKKLGGQHRGRSGHAVKNPEPWHALAATRPAWPDQMERATTAYMRSPDCSHLAFGGSEPASGTNDARTAETCRYAGVRLAPVFLSPVK